MLATCRDPGAAEDLRELACQHPGLLSTHRLDVTAPEQIADFADEIQAPVDLGVNYAGVYFERWGNDPIGSIDSGVAKGIRVNTLGLMWVTEALLPHLAGGGRPIVAAVSSHMGSIAGAARTTGQRLPLKRSGTQRGHARTRPGTRGSRHQRATPAPWLGPHAHGRRSGANCS